MNGAEPREFLPDWTIRPGVFLRRFLEDLGISEAELAERARLGPETVAGIIGGTVKIDGLIAARLNGVTGTAPFWLNAQAQYEADLARGATDTSEEDVDEPEVH